MSRKVFPQALPHYGVCKNFKRDGRRIFNSDGEVIRTCVSNSTAKRFMRTGKEGR